jgi:hypothetical protein
VVAVSLVFPLALGSPLCPAPEDAAAAAGASGAASSSAEASRAPSLDWCLDWLPPVLERAAWSAEGARGARERHMARRAGWRQEQCCQWVPPPVCIDFSGTLRPLRDELVLHERDHALLLAEEAQRAAGRAAGGARPARAARAVVGVANGSRWDLATLEAHVAPVLVVNGEGLTSLDGALVGLVGSPSAESVLAWLRVSAAYRELESALPHTQQCVEHLVAVAKLAL